MELLIVLIFIAGYCCIALEHPLGLNKTPIALLTGVLCWVFFILAPPFANVVSDVNFATFKEHLKSVSSPEVLAELTDVDTYTKYVGHLLGVHLEEISQIVFFLLGAMTIVELIDSYHGFEVITSRIKTKNIKKLLWIVCWMTFFLSSTLDNLTSSIVMISILRKLVTNKSMRMFFASMVIIAANAGGAWSPIGDVTTTMLWIGGQVSSLNIMKVLLLPSIVCLLVPLLYLTFIMKGSLLKEQHDDNQTSSQLHGRKIQQRHSRIMLIAGMAALVFVPIFKTITHLPPYIGMLFGLGALWILSDKLNPYHDDISRKPYTISGALARIDSSSVLFFLGILLAIGALESMTTLARLSEKLAETIGNQAVIITLIGIFSSIVDNVPLVAACKGMYSLVEFPKDHLIWEYLAYCAGTGGSLLVIGSAAGVAVMGLEKINFIWYAKRISFIALIGYFSGAGTYLLIEKLVMGQ